MHDRVFWGRATGALLLLGAGCGLTIDGQVDVGSSLTIEPPAISAALGDEVVVGYEAAVFDTAPDSTRDLVDQVDTKRLVVEDPSGALAPYEEGDWTVGSDAALRTTAADEVTTIGENPHTVSRAWRCVNEGTATITVTCGPGGSETPLDRSVDIDDQLGLVGDDDFVQGQHTITCTAPGDDDDSVGDDDDSVGDDDDSVGDDDDSVGGEYGYTPLDGSADLTDGEEGCVSTAVDTVGGVVYDRPILGAATSSWSFTLDPGNFGSRVDLIAYGDRTASNPFTGDGYLIRTEVGFVGGELTLWQPNGNGVVDSAAFTPTENAPTEASLAVVTDPVSGDVTATLTMGGSEVASVSGTGLPHVISDAMGARLTSSGLCIKQLW